MSDDTVNIWYILFKELDQRPLKVNFITKKVLEQERSFLEPSSEIIGL